MYTDRNLPNTQALVTSESSTVLLSSAELQRAFELIEEGGLAVVVDLDGTLVTTDTLWEGLAAVARTSPAYLWRLFPALFGGKAHFKAALAAAPQSSFDVSTLPYSPELCELLTHLKQRNIRVILATGAHRSIAEKIAKHLGCFNEVLATDSRANLTGDNKLALIREKLGGAPFAYIGNAHADMPIWRAADLSILVNAPSSCLGVLQREGKTAIALPRPSAATKLRAVLRAVRWHQCVKNTLIFLPAILSHRLMEPQVFLNSVLAFLCFTCVASPVYLLNDLADLESDRKHPTKRKRPLASGTLSIPAAIGLAGILLTVAFSAAALLPALAGLILAGYLLSNFVYSTRLKLKLSADVVALAVFYTIRVVFGGVAAGIEVSIWTLGFSVFAFLALGLVKRINELRALGGEGLIDSRRGYLAADSVPLTSQASASAYMALLVMILYLNTPQVQSLYTHPALLWLLCPCLVYWFNRIIVLANRGTLNMDPIVFAATDRASQLVAAVGAIIFIAAA